MTETRSKYRNKPLTVDGRRFASHREADRYMTLAIMQQLGHISGLSCQVPYRLVVNDTHITTYVADFVYLDHATEQTVVEDAKGVRTSAYILKRKLMKAIYGIAISEI